MVVISGCSFSWLRSHKHVPRKIAWSPHPAILEHPADAKEVTYKVAIFVLNADLHKDRRLCKVSNVKVTDEPSIRTLQAALLLATKLFQNCFAARCAQWHPQYTCVTDRDAWTQTHKNT